MTTVATDRFHRQDLHLLETQLASLHVIFSLQRVCSPARSFARQGSLERVGHPNGAPADGDRQRTGDGQRGRGLAQQTFDRRINAQVRATGEALGQQVPFPSRLGRPDEFADLVLHGDDRRRVHTFEMRRLGIRMAFRAGHLRRRRIVRI